MPLPVNLPGAGNTALLHKKIGTLDGFRGLAILLVAGYHYLHFFSFGWVGVDLFFVLSGFLITGKLAESAGTYHYFRNFYLRRVLRIVPLYFTVLLLFTVLLPLVWPSYVSASMQGLLQQQWYYWTFTANIYDAVHGWPVNISLIHFWSLCCEMQFYFLWPFVIWFFYGKQQRLYWVLLLLLLFALLFRMGASSVFSFNSVYPYVLLPCRLDAFCAGALVYLLLRDRRLQQHTNKLLLAALAALLLAMGLMVARRIPWHFSLAPVNSVGFTLNAVFWACLAAAVLTMEKGLGKNIFNSGLLKWFGRYSYGIYVFHLPVYIFAARLQVFNNGVADKTWPLAAVAFVVTCLCSFASYHLLEKYFLKLKPAILYAKM